jgi:hypothetical protein
VWFPVLDGLSASTHDSSMSIRSVEIGANAILLPSRAW